MNISAKVPMNSARSLAAIRLDIIYSRDEVDGSARSDFEERFVGWRWLAEQGSCRQPSNLFRSDRSRFKTEAQRLCHTAPVGRIGARAVVDVPLLDLQLGVAHCPRRIFEQQPLLLRRHLAEQISGLFPMIVVDAVVPMRRVPLDRHWRLGKIRLIVPESCAVGIVSERFAQIAVRTHLAVAVVALERAFGRVDWDMVEVDPEPVALGVAIGE